MPRQPSRPDLLADEPPASEQTNPLGKALTPCGLGGSDCPFEGSLKYLKQEREKREHVEGALTVRIDELTKALDALRMCYERVLVGLNDFELKLTKHEKTHRFFELAVLALFAGAGGFISRWFFPGK